MYQQFHGKRCGACGGIIEFGEQIWYVKGRQAKHAKCYKKPTVINNNPYKQKTPPTPKQGEKMEQIPMEDILTPPKSSIVPEFLKPEYQHLEEDTEEIIEDIEDEDEDEDDGVELEAIDINEMFDRHFKLLSPEDQVEVLKMQVAEAKKKVSIVIMLKGMADELLEHNTANRGKSKAFAQEFSAELISGNVELINDAVCIDTKYRMINGQGRLEACSKTGVPFPVLVAEGLSLTSFAKMDSGRKRTAAHTLAAKKIEPSRTLARIIGYTDQLKRGNTKRMIDSSNIVETYYQHSEEYQYAAKIYAKIVKHKATPAISAVASAMCLVYEKTGDKKGIDQFIRYLCDAAGPNYEKGHPVWTFLDWQRKSELAGTAIIGTEKAVYRVMLKMVDAWNRFAIGKGYKITPFKIDNEDGKLDDNGQIIRITVTEFETLPKEGPCPEILHRDLKKVPL